MSRTAGLSRRTVLSVLLALGCIWMLALSGDARQAEALQSLFQRHAQHDPNRPVIFSIVAKEDGRCGADASYSMKGEARYALLPAWDGQWTWGYAMPEAGRGVPSQGALTAEKLFALRGGLLGLRPGESVQFYVKEFRGGGKGVLAGTSCSWAETTKDGNTQISSGGESSASQAEGALDNADAWFGRTATGGELRFRWRNPSDNSACAEIVSDTAENHGFTPAEVKTFLTFTLTDDDLRSWSRLNKTHASSVESLRELGCTVDAQATLLGSVLTEDEFEASVEAAGYDTWQPKGNIGSPASAGNSMTLKAWVHKKGNPSAKATGDAGQATFTFTLQDVSQEPGVCINWPPSVGGTPDDDLKFLAEANPDTEPVSRREVRSKGRVAEVSATVSAFDFGAWGHVKVTAVTRDGKKLPVHFRNALINEIPISLPLDEDANHIADSWKREFTYGKAADADDEDLPKGNEFKGDGLTLYEEYRGFVEKGEHAQANPEKKDFFVLNTLGEVAEGGLRLFAKASELEVHHRFTSAELDWTRVINPHSGSGHQQHGVVLAAYESPGDERDYSQAVGGPGTPAMVSRVFVSALNIATKQPVGPPEGDGSITDLDAEIAHELLHACNVRHHGDGDVTEVTWKLKLGGLVYELNGTDADIEIRPFLEQNGSVSPLDWKEKREITVWLGVPQGEHSGAENCLMRYHKKIVAYRGAGPVRYLTDGGPTGLTLCNTREGATINASTRTTPQPRWGLAPKGRGNCKGQIVVSDRYTPPAR